MTAVEYELEPVGHPLYPRRTSCWWCHEAAHLPGWRACPVVYVPVAELSPERRELRAVLS